MTQKLTQRKNACSSCPWLPRSLDRHGCYFDPAVLERTIVTYLREERLHPCHSGDYFCSGYLSYVEQHIQDGIVSLKMGRFAMMLKLLDRDLIPVLETFASIDLMLAAHGRLLELEDKGE